MLPQIMPFSWLLFYLLLMIFFLSTTVLLSYQMFYYKTNTKLFKIKIKNNKWYDNM